MAVNPEPAPVPSEVKQEQSLLKVPETQVLFPTFPMVIREWFRLRKWVGMLADPAPFLENVGWACVGGLISGILALIVWIPTELQLAQPVQDKFAWETPVILVFMAASLLGCVYSFWVKREVSDVVRRDARMVADDMDHISKHNKLKEED